MTHYHFTVVGYQHMQPDGGLRDSCGIEIIADSEEDAIEKAKLIIEKLNYRIQSVRECHTNMDFVKEVLTN